MRLMFVSMMLLDCVMWTVGSHVHQQCLASLAALVQAVPPEPIAPPIPDDEDFIRVWSPAKIAALDELIHADACAGKHWKLPKGYFAKDGWIWRDVERLPKTWAARTLAGCLEVEADPRQFNRKSYMVPLDTYELYFKE